MIVQHAVTTNIGGSTNMVVFVKLLVMKTEETLNTSEALMNQLLSNFSKKILQ